MPIVLKASGLALGKGVLICNTLDDAKAGVAELMMDKKVRGCGQQDRHRGVHDRTGSIEELALPTAKAYKLMSSSQDHKRAGDGTVIPDSIPAVWNFLPGQHFYTEVDDYCRKNIYQKDNGCHGCGGRRPFRGVLYFGLMLTPDGPSS